MTSYREALLGIPEQVQAGVDKDLRAAITGPAALDGALARLTRDEIGARYRALLGRNNHAATMRDRDARADHERADARAERAAVRRGGNR